MPGILPMKVIKLGNSAQTRIAQACDRCRSKKIRCDGIRPCCSQCANVGFECKTSDKLSRRAFPRGYTESLEERVRILEAEVRELKDLLDEKDEKIDMLSKMHSNRRPSMTISSATPAPDLRKELMVPKEDMFRVQASPLLLGVENSDSYFMGASSGRAFVDTFKRRIQESGKSLAGFNTEAFLNVQGYNTPIAQEPKPKSLAAPPRMFSDRCLNIYFQEWAPLFPVLHKPSFLRLYEEYMAAPEAVKSNHKLAQLHLVFGIAALSSDMPDREHIQSCEDQWHASLDAVLMDNTLVTLQCLVLALIYCISKADYVRLQHYKGIAVGLSHRLGLHQSQKRFSFGALTIETRKKVFWTLYTVDCFSSAILGLPKLLKEDDIHAEYPADTDDEYVTEKGFQPTLPGESTKISSALALFRASRILSKVLEQNYPSAATHDISLQALLSLETELNQWSDNLPPHLKLTFHQDKPSTDITGSRSALLSLAYYYIRSLIHRPAVGSTLGQKSSPSVISLAESSKHIIQIVQLLEERSMSFSFCLNKNETLTLCGLSLLYQGLDLKQEGKLMQDGQRLIRVVIEQLERAKAPGAADFKKLAGSLIKLEPPTPAPVERSFKHEMPAPKCSKSDSPPSNIRKQLQPHLHKASSVIQEVVDPLLQQEKLRRATVPNLANPKQIAYLQQARHSMDSLRLDSNATQRDHRSSAPQLPTLLKLRPSPHTTTPNLDYLSLNNTPLQSPQLPLQHRTQKLPRHALNFSNPPIPNVKQPTTNFTEWETLLGSLDAGQANIYDAIYGSSTSTMALPLSETTYPNHDLWSPDSGWDMTSLSMHDFTDGSAPARSVLSFSEESLSSGEDLSASDYGFGNASGLSSHNFKQAMSLQCGGSGLDGEGFLLDGLDGTFGL